MEYSNVGSFSSMNISICRKVNFKRPLEKILRKYLEKLLTTQPAVWS